ncbi:hexaprenyldihydroxybenzoate methyltransferase precursor [Ophiocordyceps camponoti-floridani]|uniref:Ubiquinone biosynthesis O-methyltransferase, mitochondrial n=1 Tax=Ophiocordyceps camponoti-floridani TaxID=2030778 RepID=A0A8H4QDM6_9HYPO|nr:hexaprenyldihydroxybenzoate methyltransferase precursor [Ophiocordyceps camponoti-floridani]
MAARLRPVAARLGRTLSSRRRPHSTFSSVDPAEVSHFDALAGDWWDAYGSSRLLHLMNPLRHDFIRACVGDSLPDAGLSYLDMGCGGGIFAESAARLSTTRYVTGMDPTPSVVAAAKAHARKDPLLSRRLEYRVGSVVEALALGRVHDVVTLFEVLEHVDHPASFLQQIRPLVRPGGLLVVSTMARTWTSWLTTKLAAEYVLGIVPRGTHDWSRYINDDELRRFLLDGGWESPRVMGVAYVPGLGWRELQGGQRVGNYFLGVRRRGVDGG